MGPRVTEFHSSAFLSRYPPILRPAVASYPGRRVSRVQSGFPTFGRVSQARAQGITILFQRLCDDRKKTDSFTRFLPLLWFRHFLPRSSEKKNGGMWDLFLPFRHFLRCGSHVRGFRSPCPFTVPSDGGLVRFRISEPYLFTPLHPLTAVSQGGASPSSRFPSHLGRVPFARFHFGPRVYQFLRNSHELTGCLCEPSPNFGFRHSLPQPGSRMGSKGKNAGATFSHFWISLEDTGWKAHCHGARNLIIVYRC